MFSDLDNVAPDYKDILIFYIIGRAFIWNFLLCQNQISLENHKIRRPILTK